VEKYSLCLCFLLLTLRVLRGEYVLVIADRQADVFTQFYQENVTEKKASKSCLISFRHDQQDS